MLSNKFFRQSHIILIFRILALQFFVVFLYLLIRLPKSFLIGESFFSQLYSAGSIFYLILSFIEFVMLLVIVLSWANEQYEIRDGIIFHRRGILKLEEDSYSLKNLGSSTIFQSLVGKIFNFGTIKVYSPILKQDFYLINIHNPKEISKVLEAEIGNLGSKENIIPKRK